jgi:cytochrome c oxidase subunit 2
MSAPRSVLLIAVMSGILTGCRGGPSRNMLSPAGPGARSLAFLGTWSFAIFSVATVVTWLLLAFAATRRRGTLAEHAPADAGGGQLWLLIGGIIVPGVTFAVLFVLTLLRMDDFPVHDGVHRTAEIRVVGHRWWWEMRYLGDSPDLSFATANELHIPVGQPVELELQSVDVIHSFWVPALHGKVDLIPGSKNRLRLQADEPGTYEGQCAEFCGAEHANMRILVVAETREDYAKWIANQAHPAAPLADALSPEGQRLFETRACALCHTVRGTQALGTIGPDLTHLAARKRLAANSIPNRRAYLAAWAIHAQTMKPEAIMPNLTDFTGPELTALTHYLEGLQ